MARKRADDDSGDGVAEAVLPPPKRVKITHYKVRTSQGRMIDGQIVELPVDEADALVEAGHATHAPIE